MGDIEAVRQPDAEHANRHRQRHQTNLAEPRHVRFFSVCRRQLLCAAGDVASAARRAGLGRPLSGLRQSRAR